MGAGTDEDTTTGVYYPVQIKGNTATGKARFKFIASTSDSQNISFQFMYGNITPP